MLSILKHITHTARHKGSNYRLLDGFFSLRIQTPDVQSASPVALLRSTVGAQLFRNGDPGDHHHAGRNNFAGLVSPNHERPERN